VAQILRKLGCIENIVYSKICKLTSNLRSTSDKMQMLQAVEMKRESTDDWCRISYAAQYILVIPSHGGKLDAWKIGMA